MDYRIIEKPSFGVIGKPLRVTLKGGQNFWKIPEFWMECGRDGTFDKLFALKSPDRILGEVILGLCFDFSEDMQDFTYAIAVEGPAETIIEGLVTRTIPAATWAVFEGKGPVQDTIKDVWDSIFSRFFVEEEYRHGDAPDFELYPSGDPSKAGYVYEVWVPVIKK